MKVCSCNAWFSRDVEEYAFGGYELGLGWGVGVRKGDSECSDEEEGNWENRWRAVLGLRGIAEVERRSIRCAEAFCGRSVLEGVAGRYFATRTRTCASASFFNKSNWLLSSV